jgi:hypothetical protein
MRAMAERNLRASICTLGIPRPSLLPGPHRPPTSRFAPRIGDIILCPALANCGDASGSRTVRSPGGPSKQPGATSHGSIPPK